MEYCEVCDCYVACANWDQHCAGRRHQANLTEWQTDYCDICDCEVPSANWDQHCAGRRHQENLYWSDEESYEDGDWWGDDATEDEYDDTEHETILLPVECIWYKQDSIAPRFSDGTSFEEVIDSMYSGHHPLLTVMALGDGTYVAMNTRTLYCIQMAGLLFADVLVYPGVWTGRTYDDVRVRGIWR